VYQHGTIGAFIRQELEGNRFFTVSIEILSGNRGDEIRTARHGGFSSFIRCVYKAKRVNNNIVTLVYV
ncbi:hypothetical protein DICVIV_14441, partial [Dictyocaulus viviparus]